MYRTVEEIISTAKQQEVDERAKMEDVAGDLCDALRGFIDVSVEWKTAVDRALNIDPGRAQRSLFVARAMSLSLLTTRILTTAYEIPRALMSGAFTSTVVNWRYVAEAKNIALMIDLDVVGPMGFLWVHYGMIEQAKVNGAGDDSRVFAHQAKQILADAGFQYDGKARDPWAIIDGKKYANSISRSEYVWRHRKFPPEASSRIRSELAAAEQRMIRASNMFAHPTVTPREILEDKLYAMVLATVLDPMAVMLAYKVAASEVAGWSFTKTVGEQFHVYPPQEEQARTLSFMVKEMYDHCFKVFQEQFLGQVEGSTDE